MAVYENVLYFNKLQISLRIEVGTNPGVAAGNKNYKI